MPSLADVFRQINGLKNEGVIREYAVGGATAVLFYAEPARTYDVDVFVSLPPSASQTLLSISGLYDWARQRGFDIDAEHILIHGVPVQFLPAYNPLAEDAISSARIFEYEGVPVRVIGPEHLIALALQAGGKRRRERAWQVLESHDVDRQKLKALLAAHDIREDVGGGDST
jgi:hypothetical protein